jgi:DNA-binding XRE family transcriptional regulator
MHQQSDKHPFKRVKIKGLIMMDESKQFTHDTHNEMTGAELQTLREAARITREALAEACGVEARTVKHWETRKGFGVPADVWHTMADLIEWINKATGEAIEAASTAPGAPVVLVRYRDSRDMPKTAHGLRADVHGAVVCNAFTALTARGLDARVVWFEPDSFAQWIGTQQVQGQPESAQRAAWAAQQGLADQAKPHRGDQPNF